MSSKNYEEGLRWLEQARRDLEDSKILLEAESYASSCFHAQQAAEKALKGFLYFKGLRAIITHSIIKLLEESVRFDVGFKDFLDYGMELDRHYIGSRYPNFYPEGPAYKYYSRELAERCLRYAMLILERVEKSIVG